MLAYRLLSLVFAGLFSGLALSSTTLIETIPQDLDLPLIGQDAATSQIDLIDQAQQTVLIL